MNRISGRTPARAAAVAMAFPSQTASLEAHDPEMFDLIEREKNRQWKSLELIASEVRLRCRCAPVPSWRRLCCALRARGDGIAVEARGGEVIPPPPVLLHASLTLEPLRGSHE